MLNVLPAVVMVGFSEPQYIAQESSLVLEVVVELLEGELDIPVSVNIAVQPSPDDLAIGKGFPNMR